MKRLAIVGTVAMFALALLPATARARLIGPTLPLSRFGWGGPFGLHTTGFTGPSSDWFDPALKVGGSPRSVTYDDQSELLFNAMLKR
jgi:hypothetical protein